MKCPCSPESRSAHPRAAARALLALLALGVAACDDGPEARATESHATRTDSPALPVVVTTLSEHEFVDTIEALGTARANESVVISAQVTETVSHVRFEDGQVVEEGDVLVELTSREETAQLEEAQANDTEARRQYERAAELVRSNTASQALLDERTAARDAAHARLDELRARMRDRSIRAPFRGVLGLRAVSPGTLVQPGDPITTLDDIDVIKLDFSVPELFLAVVHAGQRVRATAAAYPDRVFEGPVQAIDTRVDPQTRAARVRALLTNPEHRLRPGMLLTVTLRANARTTLAIPEHALVPVGESQFTYVLDGESRARRVELTTGRRERGLVEVLSGLSGDETVVLEGGATLQTGALVRIVRRDASPGGDGASEG